ncbi:hypothetical protein DL1_10060 [Thioclava dalianensis]|uniref:Uncharacterized protein n=1 Tax=Thioclava dalianensis TaxID=1185766 RepID=A0A074U8I8_9RHOB|nr:hypothetical protein [Thioclava dalianensis]KEP70987.1 hypothetical protein DL1_10060 [Thioclava dalianensis]SFN27495.1 hypothetical protein SAMN05216224_103282 [Thioclava dalianensis]
MQDQQANRVRRRRVFYIPGYDPIHPRRYRELYRKEGAEQAQISGYEIALAPKKSGSGPYGWHVRSVQDGTEAEADIEVLVWSDIVRASMGKSIAATYGQLVRTAATYIVSGALFGLMRLRKGPVIAALYPIVALSVQALLGLGLGWGLAALLLALLPDFPLDWVLGLAVGLGVMTGALRWFRRHDNRFFAYYLMHDYAFTARWGGANPPELEARMASFAARIEAAMAEDWDEVLIVGHSSGAHLAVSILADLLREERIGTGPSRPALSFLSLGQVVPMVSYLPRATRLRADLAYLSTARALFWLDVTAPGDGCAFALCDPVAVSGVAPADQIHPLVISAAFTQTLSPERWKALRWRFFRLHFQYLCAFDKVGDYDYFRITAGSLSLASRFAGRAPSKSRITTQANRHTGIA